MRVKKKLTWLLLLLRLPATHTAERVAIWRKLKKSGAVQIQTSTYVLPDEPARYEMFQWLTQHIRDTGGDATLVRARVDRFQKQFRESKQTDFFNCPKAQDVEMLLRKLEGDQRGEVISPKVNPREYRGRTWLTRPRPEIDRVGSAWLIRKFIDPRAKFIFAKTI